MKILQGFKFRLRPDREQEESMRRFAGCCRFVWNKALALKKEAWQDEKKSLSYCALAGLLKEWKGDPSTSFLKDAHSQILQQALKDLDRAYKNFFQGRAGYPRFHKKGVRDSFRYPQGYKLDEENARIYLPKIGWMRYRKSREVLGKIRNVTVSLKNDRWYVSIQTGREIPEPVHPSSSSVGIDMGIVRFATLSDGSFYLPLDSFKKHETVLRKAQKALSRKQKFSQNWYKAKVRVSRIHEGIANARKDFLHKTSTEVSKNHALVVLENLQVQNMSGSARGTLEDPGKCVKSKSGLNKSILDQGWFEFRRQLEYKLRWRGGYLILVPPQNTSRRCPVCGYISKENRPSQAQFRCLSCGHEANADENAARNILAAGLAVSACGEDVRPGRNISPAASTKQEPAEISQTGLVSA
jgi:putative transposase